MAVATSLKPAIANPVTIALWGLIVAAMLVPGSLPLLIGLAIVMPIPGHATWHLYRKPVRWREPANAAADARSRREAVGLRRVEHALGA